MLAILCLLAALGLGRCLDHLPTREEIEISINRTIEEVERKIQADPSLPKLSRKDIVDILQNITTKDLISDYKTLEKTRNDYQRALMVVLPYNSNGAEENLKHLYTKPPMVQLLSDEDVFNEQERNQLSKEDSRKQVSDNFIPTSPTAESAHELVTTEQQNDNEKVDPKSDSTPLRFSFDLGKLSAPSTTTRKPVHTWKPIPKVSNPPEAPISVDFVYSTTEKPYSKSTQHVLSFDQWRYHPPPSTTSEPKSFPTTTSGPKNPPFLTTSKSKYPQTEQFLPTIQSSPEKQYEETTKEDLYHFKFLESDVPLAKTEQSSPVFVTPMSDNFHKITTTGEPIAPTSPSAMRPEVEDLLESIGLKPINKPGLTFDKKTLESKFQIPDSNNVVYNPNSGLTTAGIDTTSLADQNTFDNSDNQLKKGVENLTPAVQLLFKKFGLPTNLQLLTTTTTTVKPTLASYYSYTNFKPLPNSSVRDKEMREFLAKFGLGGGETRNQKALKPRKTSRDPPSLIEVVPNNMKKILENIGLIRPRARSDDSKNNAPVHVTPPAPKLHVFKPHEVSVFNDQQRSKINELLDTVKKVQQGKANIETVQKVADEVLESTKTLPEGPDPVSLEEILKLYKEDLKNEVRRQAAEKAKTEVDGREKVANLKEGSKEKEKEVTEEKVVKKEKAEKIVEEAKNIKEGTSKELSSGIEEEKKETEDQKLSFTSMASSDSQAASQDIIYTSVTTTTSATTTAKKSFFDTFDLDAAIKNINADGAKNSALTDTNNSNLSALEESFGGTTQKPDPVLPTRRRTGLYFLVDWNSFLEVGEEGKDKVNLRFQPKVGDRTRFIKVTVP